MSNQYNRRRAAHPPRAMAPRSHRTSAPIRRPVDQGCPKLLVRWSRPPTHFSPGAIRRNNHLPRADVLGAGANSGGGFQNQTVTPF